MIIHLKKSVDNNKINELAELYQAIIVNKQDSKILVTGYETKNIQEIHKEYIDEIFVMDSDIQLANIKYDSNKRQVNINGKIIGGKTNNTIVITGPCSIESEEQIEQTAKLLIENGLTTLRAGCYKPRTSPYSFQGLGLEGLKLLSKMRDKYGFSIITEVRDSSHVDDVINYADIIQIGAKAMYDHAILRKCGKTNKPVLLKRGFGTTLQEFVQSAEFILSGGNENVILCERGIRTFESKTRFTLDLCGVAYLKEYTNLPIILDPSHAMGYSYGVPDLARACFAMGIDGLLIESHPNPKFAKSDSSQQLNHDEFTALFKSLAPLAKALEKNII